ncbi:MAG TPA: molybdopterin-dependent oxidoreductase [Candidatus Polarisedimenticolaceae bacterium]|nr:molybdopterin-dependent oxidoreductase [Candidatus Polarisedimenticolaceae bacterium]
MADHVEPSHRVRGYCALCTAHCATVATVENGKVTRLEADHDHPNGGVLCIKGKAAPELIYHPDRLNYPLKRTRPKSDVDPGWQRVSWEHALDEIAERLISIRERFGARAVALAKGTRGGTSVSDAERWLARFLNSFGSPNWVSTTHVCNWHKDTGFSYTFGVEIPTPDVAHSNAFLLWGHNPSSTSLILAHDIVAAKKRGMKMVAVDPRRVGTAAQADVLLQVRPGADGALALALIDVVIEEKLYDQEFVRQWTNGPLLLRIDTSAVLTEADVMIGGSPQRFVVWDESADAPVVYDPSSGSFEKSSVLPALWGERRIRIKSGQEIFCRPVFAAFAALAATYNPERSQAITWVPAEKVRRAAHLLAANRPVSLYMHNGVGQHTNATQTSRAIATLYALLGDFDRPGGNVVFPKAPVNAVSGKEFLPTEVALQRIGRERKPLGPPAKPGNCAAYDIFTAILEGTPYPVKAVLNFGSNTVMSTGDSQRAREAFRALDFAVATELFMTPTAELCDYVLPATSFLEMGNFAAGFEHRPQGKLHLQYRPPVVPPVAERRSDTWMIFELAKRVGLGPEFWQGDTEAGYEHELAPSGVTLAELKGSPGGISVAATPRYRKFAAHNKHGIARGFNTPDKKVAIYSHAFASHGFSPLPEYVEPLVSPLSRSDLADEYPLVLTNAKFTTYIHSQLRGLSSLRKTSPEPTADIHPDTAVPYGIKNRDWMIIESPRGAIMAKARVTEAMAPGVVCCQHGWWQDCKQLGLPGYASVGTGSANPSLLIGSELADPISGSLPHRSYLCRVRPAK